jgi:hypothetical protein
MTMVYALRMASFLRAWIVYAYSASLNAKRKAAVMTLCVTLGPMPATLLAYRFDP